MNKPVDLICTVLLCASALLPAQCVIAQARPAAVVTDLGGEATLANGTRRVPVRLLTELGEGDIVELAAGARMSFLLYVSSTLFAAHGPARLRVGRDGPETLAGAPPERQSGVKIPPLNATGLIQAGVHMRGMPTSRIRLVSPVGTRVLDASPEFVWEPVAGAEAYRFALFDDKGVEMHRATVRAERLALPAGVILQSGQSYTWRVSARVGSAGPTANAGFSTASPDLAEEARRYRPSEGASVSELVGYAIWLGQARLLEEARRYWTALSARMPNDSTLKTLGSE